MPLCVCVNMCRMHLRVCVFVCVCVCTCMCDCACVCDMCSEVEKIGSFVELRLPLGRREGNLLVSITYEA